MVQYILTDENVGNRIKNKEDIVKAKEGKKDQLKLENKDQKCN